MNEILCIGELLIDFICLDVGNGLIDGKKFIKKAGGAPANVAASISKLGGKAFFAGKIGRDTFGIFLRNTLNELEVDTSMLLEDEKEKTTLAFVSLDSNGERDFIFNRGADKNISLDEIDLERVRHFKIFHFGSATGFLGGNLTKTYFEMMKIAKKNNIFISFDPNYRQDLWEKKTEKFIKYSKKALKFADFAKLSDEEIRIISGKNNLEEGIDLLHEIGIKVLAITLGKKGTLISVEGKKELVRSIKVQSIDSTGAGDAFVGGTLYQIAKLNNPQKEIINIDKLKEIIYFSNKIGAIVCTKFGALTTLPTLEEVKKFKKI